MIERDFEGDDVDFDQEEPEERVVPNPEYDPEKRGNTDSDVQPFIVEIPLRWQIRGS